VARSGHQAHDSVRGSHPGARNLEPVISFCRSVPSIAIGHEADFRRCDRRTSLTSPIFSSTQMTT
jgi:hypothetical protein